VCVSESAHVCVTCVLPPVLSCTRLRDMEQVMAKVWKKELTKLHRPRAISSYRATQSQRVRLWGKVSHRYRSRISSYRATQSQQVRLWGKVSHRYKSRISSYRATQSQQVRLG
jgi:predicted DNA-binding WGR domain protein